MAPLALAQPEMVSALGKKGLHHHETIFFEPLPLVGPHVEIQVFLGRLVLLVQVGNQDNELVLIQRFQLFFQVG